MKSIVLPPEKLYEFRGARFVALADFFRRPAVIHLPAYPHRTRVVAEDTGGFEKSVRIVPVITIQVGDDFASGACDPLIDGIGLTTVFRTHPAREPRFILLENRNCLVLTSSIVNEVFEIRVSLQQDRADRLFNIGPLVEARRRNADLRPFAAPMWNGAFERPRPTDLARRRRW